MPRQPMMTMMGCMAAENEEERVDEEEVEMWELRRKGHRAPLIAAPVAPAPPPAAASTRPRRRLPPRDRLRIPSVEDLKTTRKRKLGDLKELLADDLLTEAAYQQVANVFEEYERAHAQAVEQGHST